MFTSSIILVTSFALFTDFPSLLTYFILFTNFIVCLHSSFMANVLKFHTPVADKMAYANKADPDQTALERAVWSGSTLFAIPLSILTA